MPPVTAAIIAVWGVAMAGVLAAPGIVYALWRRGWTRLPNSGALLKGSPFPPAVVDDALCAFRRMRALDTKRLLVEFRDGEWFRHPTAGNQKLAGIELGPKSVIVAVPSGARIGETALFHELMHCAIEQEGRSTRHEDWVDDDLEVVDSLKRSHR